MSHCGRAPLPQEKPMMISSIDPPASAGIFAQQMAWMLAENEVTS